MADLESSVQAYNEPAKSESNYHVRDQVSRAKQAAQFIHETANDPRENPTVRERAQALLDEHIDPKDVTVAKVEREAESLVVAGGLSADKRTRTAPSAVKVKTTLADGNTVRTQVGSRAALFKTAPNPYGENYTLLARKDVTIDLPMQGGGTAKLTVDAQGALNNIDERLSALDMVQGCLL